jgi:cytosine/adenosine deaminase-related metal-dependent hydrolase
MRGVSYAEVIGLGPRKSVAEAALLKIRNLAEKHQRRCKIWLGISPHAPYTLEPGMVKNCVIAAQAMGLPLTMHLAEHPEELAFMTAHGGELRQLYQQAPLEDWGLERFAGSPIELAKWAGMLTGGKPWAVSVAHGNYLSDLDIRLLNAATVVYCPRTHAYFGHAAHPLPRLIRAGVRVALGTDSAASSGDLNLLLDGQKVWETFGQSGIVSAGCIWRMMTSQAAHALGLGSQLGQLRRGFVANMAAWNVAETSADILANVLKTAPLPLGLWLDGERVKINQPKSGG